MKKLYTAAALLLGSLGFVGMASARSSSIDCKLALTVEEKAICAHYHLGQLDARMATLFDISKKLVGMGERGNIIDEQHSWLDRRRDCGDSEPCLRKAYETRIGELEKVIDRVASGGPY